jgi:hypothetical protein
MPLPNRNVLDGTKSPATTTSEMKAALGQLRDYLDPLAQVSLAGNGYQKLPSSVIIQWGQTSNVAASGVLAITLPVAFPGLRASVTVTYINTAAYSPAFGSPAQISAKSPTGFSIYNGGTGISQYLWIAIGY